MEDVYEDILEKVIDYNKPKIKIIKDYVYFVDRTDGDDDNHVIILDVVLGNVYEVDEDRNNLILTDLNFRIIVDKELHVLDIKVVFKKEIKV